MTMLLYLGQELPISFPTLSVSLIPIWLVVIGQKVGTMVPEATNDTSWQHQPSVFIQEIHRI